MFLLLNDAFADDKPATSKTLYRCSFTPRSGYYAFDGYSTCRFKHVTEHPDVKCPSCRHLMNVPLKSVSPTDKDNAVVKEAVGEKRKLITGGYVKNVVTYMVMDNLVVKPISTISSITLINKFGVNDLSRLEEKTLPFGKDETLKLLKASLMTDQVLTTLLRQDD
ncbi:unnamed protein product [Lactuca virosa]|uniref:DUF674 domain-containing protein n=1 Tax=Lactuca virosa TaxID=75947 RepID=A0AAU9P065_9ASTR|nr:unnamed protein product [Lactuca virosa]